jgi:hypothetical protein
MWNAVDAENKAAKNIAFFSSCGVAYGSTTTKAKANEIDMITVSTTAVPRSNLIAGLCPLNCGSRRHAALDSAPTEAPAAETTAAEAAKKIGRSSIMAITFITADQLDQMKSRRTLRWMLAVAVSRIAVDFTDHATVKAGLANLPTAHRFPVWTCQRGPGGWLR